MAFLAYRKHRILFYAALGALAFLILSLSLTLPARPAEATTVFTPSCQSAAGGTYVRDAELNPHEMLAVWQTDPVVNSKNAVITPGSVHIASIDRNTGKFLTASEMLFTNTNPAPIDLTLNGPEWGCSQNRCAAYFTSYNTSSTNLRLGKVFRGQLGKWNVTFLPQGNDKSTAFATLDFASPDPISLYYINTTGNFKLNTFKSQGTFGWRTDVSNPVDTTMPAGTAAGRWVPGTKQVVVKNFVQSAGATTMQVLLYDTATKKSDVVVSGLQGSSVLITPFAWQAPEFGGATAVLMPMNTLSNSQTINVYRKNTTTGAWDVYTTITPPDPTYGVLWSPEPFVFKGHSYLSFAGYKTQVNGSPTGPSEVWIVSVDPTLSPAIRQQVSVNFDPNEESLKNDPETLPIASGTKIVVYYIDKGTATLPMDTKVCDAGL